MDIVFVFGLYLASVFVLAWLAGRVRQGKSFVGDYFLGSRGLGVWTFALTYAATVASGGTFVGVPALVYTHGWSAGLWICSYMVVPLVALGLIAKRINQVSRTCGAITIPELFTKRFDSQWAGLTATCLVLFFLFFFLLAQFKAGAQIMAILMEGVPVYEHAVGWLGRMVDGVPWVGAAEPDYLLCLSIFGISVIVYTAYGGFRAVVWTDVMQGVVMGLGVVLLLVFAWVQVGGWGNATRQLQAMTPPEFSDVVIERADSNNTELRIARGTWLMTSDGLRVARVAAAMVLAPGQTRSDPVEALLPTTPEEIKKLLAKVDPSAPRLELVGDLRSYAYGAGQTGVYTSAPGPSRTNPAGFLPIMLAFSFFVFWNFAMVGNPAFMVRQMAYRDTRTLRRAMMVVAVYFGIIYFPLVLIFTAARVLMPGMEIFPDRVMPEMAAFLSAGAGVPWLAGVLIAAPFAAVMSSVDSFLLMVSSGLVRDVYQDKINPGASEQRMKILSYCVTTAVGVLAFLAVLHPPLFLQDLIVFSVAGLAACFLMPGVLSLYWPRMTGGGAVAGMLGGCGTILALYITGYVVYQRWSEYHLLGIHPFLWSMLVSGLLTFLVSLCGPRPALALRQRFFGTQPSS